MATLATTIDHMTTTIPTGTIHDFDFLVGTWEVANRRLRERGVGSNDWEEFPATMSLVQRLGGVVNVDQIDFPTKGFSGLTLRSFDIEQQRWSIYWINSERVAWETNWVMEMTRSVAR